MYFAAALFALVCLPLAAKAQNQRPKPAPAAALLTVNPVVSQFEDGPPLAGDQKLVVGEYVNFRFGAANFRTSDDGVVKLSGHVQVFDPRGTAIAPPDEVAIATSLHEEDKDWRPVLHSQFQLPGIAPPGTYKIRYEVVDEQAKRKASGETTFEVTGPDVAPSSSLVVRHVAFYRGAEDPEPLGVAAYRPGEMVWVRFDITGFKYGEQNSIDVTYDVAVLASDGRQMFSQEDAAAEKSQSFYPQPWIPGTFSLVLQPDTPLGTYTLVITARDAPGKQSVTEKAEFKVE